MTLPDKFRPKDARATIAAYVQIVIGCVVGGAAYPLFLVPGSIAPGGLTGVATILNHLAGLPVGMTSLVMNVPLFIIGYKAMGRVFVWRSLVATVLFSLAIDALRLPAATVDPMLGTLFGGLLLGIGLGLIIRGGATTGGTDMIARMVHQRFQFITVGIFLLLIDCCVVLAAAFFIGVTEALYALICIYVSSKMVDVIMLGISSNKACFIMSGAWEKITQRIFTELNRGATHLTARGAYSGQDRPVLLCVTSPQEVARLKAIVHEEDEQAFMFITDAHEALGEGFTALSKNL